MCPVIIAIECTQFFGKRIGTLSQEQKYLSSTRTVIDKSAFQREVCSRLRYVETAQDILFLGVNTEDLNSGFS